MKRKLWSVMVLALAAGFAVQAAAADRWLHVKVEKTGDKPEYVRVNIPLALAEKVLPAVQAGALRQGRVRIEGSVNGIDLRAIFDAVRTLGDGEFVTVETEDETIRVAKEKGFLVARIDERTGSQDKVDVRIPMVIVEALLSGPGDELNLAAAVRALSEHGDELVINVSNKQETVRVWVDSKNTMD